MAKAIVAGASGLIGGYLVRELLRGGFSTVTALVRNPIAPPPAGLHQIKMDFTKLDEVAADAAGADVFCTLGTTIKTAGSEAAFRAVDFDAVFAFAQWAHKRGAKRFFVVTAMGANAKSSIFYNRVKGEIEAELTKVGFTNLCIFRPSLLLGPRKEFRRVEQFASRISGPLKFLLIGPLAKYRPIPAETVAKAMVAAAQSSLPPGVHIFESDEIAAMVYEGAH